MAELRKLGFVGTIGENDDVEVEPESSDSDEDDLQVSMALCHRVYIMVSILNNSSV